MDIRKIKKLIELLVETGISEIEIKEGEESVRLSRQVYQPETMQARSFAPIPQSPSQTMTLPAIDAPALSLPSQKVASGHQILSPMVGTMYSSPSPDTPPFVMLGQTIKAGDTLCIVEAMKMFNEIEADRPGKIVDICVNNGDPVEYNQVLFVIEE